MNVIALYDIHGNLPALEAVLAEVELHAPDLLVVGGDVVPGPLADGCLDAIERSGLPWIGLRGNGENDVLATRAGEVVTRVPESVRPILDWAARALTAEHAGVLASWPAVRVVEIQGLGRVLFCHATPRDDNEIFTERTPLDRVAPAFAGVDADLVVCGHTHIPFDRVVDGLRVVNAGSVGMPFGDTVAQWLVCSAEGVVAKRTPYDLASAAARMDGAGFPMPMDPSNPRPAEVMIEAFEAIAMGGEG